MVDTFGRWTEEQDYAKYPRSKWCDFDHVANYIREQKYLPTLPMADLIDLIIFHFCDDEDYNPKFGEDLMICIPTLDAFIYDNGGIKEFDAPFAEARPWN